MQVCCGGHKGTSRGASLGNEPGSNISWSFPTVLPWSCSQAHVVIILTESVLALSKSGLRILHLSVLRFHRGQEARQDGQFLPLSLPMASVPSFPSSRLSFPPLSFHSFSLHCRGLQTVTRLGAGEGEWTLCWMRRYFSGDKAGRNPFPEHLNLTVVMFQDTEH